MTIHSFNATVGCIEVAGRHLDAHQGCIEVTGRHLDASLGYIELAARHIDASMVCVDRGTPHRSFKFKISVWCVLDTSRGSNLLGVRHVTNAYLDNRSSMLYVCGHIAQHVFLYTRVRCHVMRPAKVRQVSQHWLQLIRVYDTRSERPLIGEDRD